jgi:hypothetical protein
VWGIAAVEIGPVRLDMTPIFNVFVSAVGGAAGDSFTKTPKVKPHTNITIEMRDNCFIIFTSFIVFSFWFAFDAISIMNHNLHRFNSPFIVLDSHPMLITPLL